MRLLTECAAPAPELFVVGDEKQSIYRFRGADVTVFNREREPLAMLPRPLCENRRSLPAIVEFVNAVSAHSMKPGDDSDDKPYKVKWSEEHRLAAIRPADDAPAVELIVSPKGQDADGTKLSTRDLRRIEADAIARRCARMIGDSVLVTDEHSGERRGVEFGDIALLLRSFTDVAIYEDAFARAAVPCLHRQGARLLRLQRSKRPGCAAGRDRRPAKSARTCRGAALAAVRPLRSVPARNGAASARGRTRDRTQQRAEKTAQVVGVVLRRGRRTSRGSATAAKQRSSPKTRYLACAGCASAPR